MHKSGGNSLKQEENRESEHFEICQQRQQCGSRPALVRRFDGGGYCGRFFFKEKEYE